MTKEETLLLAKIEDKQQQCENQYIAANSGFLDPASAALVRERFRASCVLWGGYEDAERVIAVFLPDYLTAEDLFAGEDSPLKVLRIQLPKGSKKLMHRDYLGSVLGLGIDRSVIGDIIVRDDGADMIILASMEDFLLNDYRQAGRANFECRVLPLSELQTADLNIAEKRDTVASLRLDSMIGSAFNLARGKAQEAIRSGHVFLNSVQTVKPDAQIKEGDKLVLRGRGKAVLKEVGGPTRKDRISVLWNLYK